MEDNPALNWLKNQAYWYEKNDYYDEKESEFATSVAAAAFVITSMEEAYKEHAKRMREKTKRSRKKKTNPVIAKSEVKRINRSYTQDLTIGEESFKKQQMDNPQKDRREQEIGSSSRTSGLASAPSKADSREKSQLDKIRLRYERMKAEIVGWENERKSAAKLRMEKRKSELQKRTEINNQHYKAKLARIQVIADGAKKQLEEKKRSQEAQVQEKVNHTLSFIPSGQMHAINDLALTTELNDENALLLDFWGSNYGVKELTWENGQLTVHGLGEGVEPTTASAIWSQALNGCETLESVVHQAALQPSKLQSQNGRDHNNSESKDGSCSRKRGYPQEMDCWFSPQEESHRVGHSVTASASGTNMSWASFESGRSLKTARTGDYLFSGSSLKETQETEGDEQETRGEAGRSNGRRGRAAAIHNESERRRRHRINQRMRTLQKLLPTASKADKVSILDDVIEHLKQLQAQVQFMSLRANLPQQMMMPQLPPPQSVLSIQHQQQQHQQQQQQQQFQMSLLAKMARMGMGGGGNAAYGGLVPPPPPLMIPPMDNRDRTNASSASLTDPYSAFLAQTMNMDLYNKMAAAIYRQQSDQTTKVNTSMPSSSSNHEKRD
ncbi:hypothetical protein Bca101_078477 [Brassica carinata]